MTSDEEGRDGGTRSMVSISIVTPAYNEAKNLPLIHDAFKAALDGTAWEWIVVDDHSSDDTFEVVQGLARRDERVRGVRLARNFGSHMAISCGLHAARGQSAAVMAADLQDPPDTLMAMLQMWSEGAQVVWAVRERREGEKASTVGFSRLYYYLMRRFVGIKDMPAMGADFVLIDRMVVDTIKRFRETNTSIFALITWLGYRQASVSYPKRAREHGRSSWTLEKKLKLLVDSVTSFTYRPVRAMSYMGVVVAAVGCLYACVVVVNALRGHTPQGWASILIAVLLMGGSQMLMLGILGEYLWRALDEARQRPRFWIEADTTGRAFGRAAEPREVSATTTPPS